MREDTTFAGEPEAASGRVAARIAPLLGLVLGLGFSLVLHQNAATAQELSGAELRMLLTGKVATGTTDGINDITVEFTADGRLTGRAQTVLIVDEDTGVWEIEGDELCVTWTSWADAERTCLHVEQHGDRYESFNSDRSTRSVFRVVKPQTQIGVTEGPLDKLYNGFPAALGAER